MTTLSGPFSSSPQIFILLFYFLFPCFLLSFFFSLFLFSFFFFLCLVLPLRTQGCPFHELIQALASWASPLSYSVTSPQTLAQPSPRQPPSFARPFTGLAIAFEPLLATLPLPSTYGPPPPDFVDVSNPHSSFSTISISPLSFSYSAMRTPSFASARDLQPRSRPS